MNACILHMLVLRVGGGVDGVDGEVGRKFAVRSWICKAWHFLLIPIGLCYVYLDLVRGNFLLDLRSKHRLLNHTLKP